MRFRDLPVSTPCIKIDRSKPKSLIILIFFVLLAACTPKFSSATPTTTALANDPDRRQVTPSFQSSPIIEVPLKSATVVEQNFPPSSWKTRPILPSLSERTSEIFAVGIALGNNPRAFSKVGDGEVASHWFLTIYDLDPDNYDLGPNHKLASTISYFAGSFGRESLAARAGFNTTRILDPLFAMNDICEIDESPLECELRRHRPSFAIVSLGTNQIWTANVFESELRAIVEICIDHGVVPILSTKGDNLEGDHRINTIIAGLASEYDVPLWNFWLAIQSLPDQGLQADNEHLTWAENDFSDPEVMTHAWPVRNLTALQVLETLKNHLIPE